jgi:hypothetical protein
LILEAVGTLVSAEATWSAQELVGVVVIVVAIVVAILEESAEGLGISFSEVQAVVLSPVFLLLSAGGQEVKAA